MTMEIPIVQASDKDEGSVLALVYAYDQEFTPPLSDRVSLDEYVRKLLRNGVVPSVIENDRVFGFAAFYANDPTKEVSFLSLLLVDEKIRGRGIGRVLMRWWFEYCNIHKFENLQLEVNASDHKLIDWYRQQGFEIVRCYSRHEGQALLMSKRIQ